SFRVSPDTERQTGEKDFAYPNYPATVDDPGDRRGGGAGGVRRGPTARRVRLEQERGERKWGLQRDRSVSSQTSRLRHARVHGDDQFPGRPCRAATSRQRPTAVVLHDHHHRSRGHRQRGCPRQRQHAGLPHHRQRHRQRRKDRERIERLHLLSGQVRMSNHSSRRPFVPHTIHRLAVPLLLFWVALAAVPNILVPQLEEVGRLHNVGLSSPEAPSYQAFKHIGKVFHEFDTDSSAMILLEGDKPLGADAHKFYDAMVRKLDQDKKHVQHIQDFWGDTLTAAGSQSSDGKAAYVQVFLNGAQGEALSNESVDAVRATIDHMQPPPGVKAYLTGAAPLIADQFTEGSKGSNKVTAITVGVIAVMLFFVYRSFSTTLLVLATVLIEMAAARGFVAFLGNAG